MPYVFVGPHPETLASGSPLALDQVVTDDAVNLDDPHDADLVAKAWLLKQSAAEVARAEKAAKAEAAEQSNSNGEEA